MPTVYRYSDTVADASTGRPVSNATITLTSYPTGTAATIYDVNGSIITAGSVKSGSNGRFTMYAEAGRYNVLVNSVLQQSDMPIGEVLAAEVTLIFPDIGGSGKACHVDARLEGADADGNDIWALVPTTA